MENRGIAAPNATEEDRPLGGESPGRPSRKFQSASGVVNLVAPTSAVIMGGLALSKVGSDRYLKFVWPFLLAVFVVCCASIGIAATVG